MENKSLLYPCASAARRVISLDGMWRFEFDPESNGMDAGWGVGLPKPISMPVPASFCDFFTDKESREYCGDFWYETDFFVPGEWSGKDVAIRFGSVTHRARVFVNGVEVVNHEGGFLPFDANVTEIVRYNQYNKLTVLANNELNEYMLPAGQTNTLSNGKKVAAPYFDFYNYAGIHRPVKLLALPKERVLDFEVTHRLVDGGAEVDYTVTTNGSHDVTVEVLDGTTKGAEASGKQVGDGHATAGGHSVVDHGQRRRDDNTDATGHREQSSGECLGIAGLFHLRNHNTTDGCHSGGTGAGDGCEQHTGQHGYHGQATGEAAQQGVAEIDQAPGDAAALHQVAGYHEQRNGQQREGIHGGKHPLGDNQHWGGRAAQEDAGKAGQHQHDPNGETHNSRDGKGDKQRSCHSSTSLSSGLLKFLTE